MTAPTHDTLPTGPSDFILARIADILATRLPSRGGDPETSYVAKLFSKGPDAALKKIGEEATELVMAVKDQQPERIVAETADLWFHSMVALAHYGLSPQDVIAELDKRVGTSGLEEKASRKAQDRELNESKGVKP